ncbi:hypothetical protein PFISCL1PPCAC_12273, partial [Pristionchus fissidentatus]
LQDYAILLGTLLGVIKGRLSRVLAKQEFPSLGADEERDFAEEESGSLLLATVQRLNLIKFAAIANENVQSAPTPVDEFSSAELPPVYIDEIDRVINKSYDKDTITDERRTKLEEVRTKLKKAIEKRIQKKIILDVFGSNENGFGSNQADFDICFRFEEGEAV